jgi:putative sigma-54 modulation protein
MLKTIVQGRNIKLTDSLKTFAEEKVSKVLEKFAVSIKEVDVNLSVSKGKGGEKHKCEITVFMLRMGVVRAEEVEENMYAAIENVSDIMARKMRKVKDKAIMKGKWDGRAGPRGTAHSISAALPEEVFSDDEDIDTSGTAPPLAPEVVRTKVMSLEPMSIHDAMDQAEQVGHPFYVFKDSDGTVKVLYKRQHRGYGVIVPK